MSNPAIQAAASKLPTVHPKQAALPNSIPELDELKARVFELEGQLAQSREDVAELALKNGRLTSAVAVLTEAVAWYATPNQWVRYTNHKDESCPPPVEKVRSSKAQDAIIAANNILK